MAVKNPTTINLIVGRQERTVFINTILYAEVQDKLCTIYLTRNESFSLFLPIASLMAMLPDDAFLKVSRNCVVALQYIQRIDDTNIILFNADRIPFSRRRKTVVYQTFQKYLADRKASENSTDWKLDLSAEFACFNHCPYAFFVFEVSPLAEKGTQEFHFQYANEAAAALLRIPLPRLIHTTFTESLNGAHADFLRMVVRTALSGGYYELFRHSFRPDQLMHIACYQPHYGFCACIFIPTVIHLPSITAHI